MDVRRPAAQIWGAPEIQYDYKFFGNLGFDLEEINSRLYAFGNYAERKVEGGFYFRNPNTRNGVFRGPGNLHKIIDIGDGFDPRPISEGGNLLENGLSNRCPEVQKHPAADYSNVSLPDHCAMFNTQFPGGFTPALRRLRAGLEHRLRPARDAGGPGGRLCDAQRLVLRRECLLRREQR